VNLLKNYYKILKIEKSASAEQIKKAYFKLAKKYHPDHNTLEESITLFREINEAYNVLSNDRKNYDKNSPHFKKKITLDVEIDIATNKNTYDLNYQILKNCKKCDGTGFDVTEDYVNCQTCRGKGEDDNGFECKKCYGTGKAYNSLCKNCKGKKQITCDKSVKLQLVKGMPQIVMPLLGNQNLHNNHYGNLIVNVSWLD